MNIRELAALMQEASDELDGLRRRREVDAEYVNARIHGVLAEVTDYMDLDVNDDWRVNRRTLESAAVVSPMAAKLLELLMEKQ